MGAVLKYGQKLSKTGYAKLERAETSINIQIIFDLSYLTQINFSHILTMYNHLIHTIGESESAVGFSEICGLYGIGNIPSRTKLKSTNSIKETYSAKYDSYIDVIGKQNIDLINNTINCYLSSEIRNDIKIRADTILNPENYACAIKTNLVDHEALALLKEQYEAEPAWVRREYTFDRYDELMTMGVDIHTQMFIKIDVT